MSTEEPISITLQSDKSGKVTAASIKSQSMPEDGLVMGADEIPVPEVSHS